MKFSYIFFALLFATTTNFIHSMEQASCDYSAHDTCITALLDMTEINEHVLIDLCTQKDIILDKVMPRIGSLFQCVQQLKELVTNSAGYSLNNPFLHTRIHEIFKHSYPEQDDTVIEVRIHNIFSLIHKHEAPQEQPSTPAPKIPHTQESEEVVLAKGTIPNLHSESVELETQKSPAEWLQIIQGFSSNPQSLICNYCKEQVLKTQPNYEKCMARHVQCSHSDKQKEIRSRLHKKLNGKETSAFVCPLCKKDLAGLSIFVQHIKDKHLKLKTYVCPHCQKSFCRYVQLQKHIHKHTSFTSQSSASIPTQNQQISEPNTPEATLILVSLHTDQVQLNKEQSNREIARRVRPQIDED